MDREPCENSDNRAGESKPLPFGKPSDQEFLASAMHALREHAEHSSFEDGEFNELDARAFDLLFLAKKIWPGAYDELQGAVVELFESLRNPSTVGNRRDSKHSGPILIEKVIAATDAIKDLQAALEAVTRNKGISVSLGLFSLKASDAAPMVFGYDREANPVHPLAQRIYDLQSDLKAIQSVAPDDLGALYELVTTEGSLMTDEGERAARLLYDARREAAIRTDEASSKY